MLALVVGLAALAAVAVAALLVNIFERKQEARNPFFRVVELNDTIDDPAVWGKNFPMQYDVYLRTVDMQRTKYGGSEALPRIRPPRPTHARSSRSRASRRTRGCQAMWAGLRVRRGLPRGARPRLHARGSDLHRAPAGHEAARHLPALPRLGVPALQAGRRRRPDQGASSSMNRDALRGGAQAREASGRVHRLPRCRRRMALRVTRPGFIEGIRALQGERRACRTTT